MWILTRLRVKLKSCPGRPRFFTHSQPVQLIRKRKTILSSLPRALCSTPQQQVRASQGSTPPILKLHLLVAPCPHPVVGIPPRLDRKDKEAFLSILATPDLRERNNCRALRCSEQNDSERTYLGLFSPRLSIDGQHCGQRKGTKVLRVKGWNLEAKRFKPTGESKRRSQLTLEQTLPAQTQLSLSALFLRSEHR